MARPGPASATPFFLDADPGSRFCLYHPPQGACRGALVYLHPFAEELNHTRRMAALGARALAAHGVGVLQIDLFGCGDSSGEFADARWASWRNDALCAAAWLGARLGHPPGLWGLRLGALLALDVARDAGASRLLLWQPVLRGEAMLNQFLRLRLAADLLRPGAASGGTAALRAQLARGDTLEVAGYALHGALAGALDALDAAALAPPCPTTVIELGAVPTPASLRLLAQWQAAGANASLHTVPGAPFWAAPGAADAPALLDASLLPTPAAQDD